LSKKTLETAKETGNDVIVQVKENQPNLLKDCLEIAEKMTADDDYREPVKKARHRIESRYVEIFTKPLFSDPAKWELVEAVIKVERTRMVFDTTSKCWKDARETSYYISTTEVSAEKCCQAIRNHWGIENRNHYVKDVSMHEDTSRIRVHPNIFAILRSFALNILRRNNVGNIQLELFSNCMNLENVLSYRGIMEN